MQKIIIIEIIVLFKTVKLIDNPYGKDIRKICKRIFDKVESSVGDIKFNNRFRKINSFNQLRIKENDSSIPLLESLLKAIALSKSNP